MTLLRSFLLKLGMFAMTMGTVLWIGWQTPQTVQRPAFPQAALLQPEPTAPLAAPEPRIVSGSASQVDLNRASAADFEQLPGVGPVLARRIVEYRNSLGRFHAVDDLQGVKGIGKKKLERLKPFVTVAASTGEASGKKEPT